MVESVAHDGLCSRISGSLGSMWPSQWFMRIYGAEYSMVREDLYGLESGS